MKKNWYLIIPVALLLTPLLMVGFISLSYGYSFGESWECFKAVGKSNTKFQSLQYSESRFKQIHPGMSGREVFDRIGIPLERHENDSKWLYALPVGGAEFYHERTLLLQNGVVKGVIFRFHTPESK